MLSAAALLAVAAPAAAETPEYPAREVLAAFATACSTVEEMDVARAAVAAAGWEQIPEDDSTPVGRLVLLGKSMTADMADDGTKLLSGSSYRKTVAGRQLYLALSGATLDDITSQGCLMYDFDATDAIPRQELEDWAVRTPNDGQSPGEGIEVSTWNPGLKPGHMEMEIAFFPKDSPTAKAMGISGMSFSATAMKIGEQ